MLITASSSPCLIARQELHEYARIGGRAAVPSLIARMQVQDVLGEASFARKGGGAPAGRISKAS